VQQAFTELLERRIAAGDLEIDDTERAAAQFFTLLKGEAHAKAVFGYCCGPPPGDAGGARRRGGGAVPARVCPSLNRQRLRRWCR
jgi:hypothetical protein